MGFLCYEQKKKSEIGGFQVWLHCDSISNYHTRNTNRVQTAPNIKILNFFLAKTLVSVKDIAWSWSWSWSWFLGIGQGPKFMESGSAHKGYNMCLKIFYESPPELIEFVHPIVLPWLTNTKKHSNLCHHFWDSENLEFSKTLIIVVCLSNAQISSGFTPAGAKKNSHRMNLKSDVWGKWNGHHTESKNLFPFSRRLNRDIRPTCWLTDLADTGAGQAESLLRRMERTPPLPVKARVLHLACW